jgi:hypothetical protein
MESKTNLLNKDRIWIKIKNYIYLIIFLIIFLIIILISTLVLNSCILFKLNTNSNSNLL